MVRHKPPRCGQPSRTTARSPRAMPAPMPAGPAPSTRIRSELRIGKNLRQSSHDSSHSPPLLQEIVTGVQKRPAFRVQWHTWVTRDVNPNVNMGRSAEIPSKGRPRQPPAVPFHTLGRTMVSVERQRTWVEATHFLKALEDPAPVWLSERFDQGVQNPPKLLLLV